MFNSQFQVAISGGNNADVDGPAFGGADGLDLPFLQRAEKLGLHLQRHFADLIQQQGAAIGGFHQPLLGLHRSRKRAARVAEQFRLDQGGHQRRAFHRHKRLLFSRPKIMNAARHEFLAGAALAQNQHRVVTQADFFDQAVDPLHARGHADQSSKSGKSADLLPQHAVFPLQFDGVHNLLKAGAQLFQAKRFGDVVHGSHPGGLHCGVDGSVLRQHDHGHVWKQPRDALQQFQPAGPGQPQIGQQNIHG